MELVNTYRIREVHGTECMNAPYKFLLETVGKGFPHEAGDLVLDKETCDRHGVAPSLELVGRKIQCRLTPHVLRPGSEIPEPTIPYETWAGPDDVLIDEVRRDEVWSVMRWSVGELRQKVGHSLKVYSDDGTDGIHPMPTKCPLYNLMVELTEDEFTECTRFAPGTVLTASFVLLPPNSKEEQKDQQVAYYDEV